MLRSLLLPLLIATMAGTCTDEPPPPAPDASWRFTATSQRADGSGAEALRVFEASGRSGNGETWYAILLRHLEEEGSLGGTVVVPEALGDTRAVSFDGQRTWVAFDPEAGGCLVQSGSRALHDRLRGTYERAIREPEYLRRLVKAVPDERWDD